MCSLMSPLEEVVSDHDMAVEIAKAALEELMKPEQEPELGEPIPAIQPEVDPETIEKRSRPPSTVRSRVVRS